MVKVLTPLSTTHLGGKPDVGNGIYAVVPEPPTIRLMVAVGLVLTVFAWRRLRSRAERSLVLPNRI